MNKREIAKNLIFTEIDLLRNAVMYEDIKDNDFCNHSEDGKCKIFKCKCKVLDKNCVNYDNDKLTDEIDNIIVDKHTQIEKMEKYKKSLIYEYVTGKKRVKGAEKLYG